MPDVEITLRAVDQTAGAIGKTDRELEGLNDTVEKSKSAAASSQLKWTELASAVGLAKQGYQLVKGAIESVINPTVELGTQVRNLARETGVGAEEASLMIQVADDLGVSYEALRLGSKKLSEEGIQPTFENIKDLAEQYQALPPGVERAQFAQDKFGRSSLEMQKILATSRDRLDEVAESLEGSALIMDEEGVQAVEDYRIATDELNDAKLALAVTVGTKVLPAITELITANLEGAETMADWREAVEEGTVSQDEYANVMRRVHGGVFEANEVQERLNALLAGAATQAEHAASEHEYFGDTLVILERSLDSAGQEAEEMAEIFGGELVPAADKVGLSVEGIENAFDDLQLIIRGPLGEANDEYQAKQEELATKIEETQAQIRSAWGTTKTELQTTLGELEGEYAENATAHEEATRRILFDIISQKAAMDGLTDTELKNLNDLALEWGLLDQATHDAVLRINDSMDELDSGPITDFLTSLQGGAYGAAAAFDALTSSINNVPEGLGLPPPTPPGGGGVGVPGQHGGAFIVPPGYNENYRVGPFRVSSGEMVTITPATHRTVNIHGVTINHAMDLARFRDFLRASMR